MANNVLQLLDQLCAEVGAPSILSGVLDQLKKQNIKGEQLNEIMQQVENEITVTLKEAVTTAGESLTKAVSDPEVINNLKATVQSDMNEGANPSGS